MSDQPQAMRKLQKLQIARQLKSLYIDQQYIPIVFCYGIACYPDDSQAPEILVQIAKEKMRHNKRQLNQKPKENPPPFSSAMPFSG